MYMLVVDSPLSVVLDGVACRTVNLAQIKR